MTIETDTGEIWTPRAMVCKGQCTVVGGARGFVFGVLSDEGEELKEVIFKLRTDKTPGQIYTGATFNTGISKARGTDKLAWSGIWKNEQDLITWRAADALAKKAAKLKKLEAAAKTTDSNLAAMLPLREAFYRANFNDRRAIEHYVLSLLATPPNRR